MRPSFTYVKGGFQLTGLIIQFLLRLDFLGPSSESRRMTFEMQNKEKRS